MPGMEGQTIIGKINLNLAIKHRINPIDKITNPTSSNANPKPLAIAFNKNKGGRISKKTAI